MVSLSIKMVKRNKDNFYTITNEEFYKGFELLDAKVDKNHKCVIEKIDGLNKLMSNHLAHHEEMERQENKSYIKLGIILSVLTIIINILFRIF